MKFLSQLLLALTASPFVLAGPSRLESREISNRTSPLNVFEDRFAYVHKGYADNLARVAESFREEGDEENALKTLRVAETASTFVWYYSVTAQNAFETALRGATESARTKDKKIVFPLVIYNMPDRDCSSEASAGELQFDKGGMERYKQMVDTIANTIDRYQDFNFAVVVEPDSLANMVTNVGNNRCQPALFDQYIDAYAYVIQRLQKPNVGLYIDVAHSQWLGWPDNARKVADVIEDILERAGEDTKIRGYVTNVSNYQPYKNPNPTTVNPNYDEYTYGKFLGGLLAEKGLPAHFIHDTGRSGRPEALVDGVWCNLKGAGLGPRPSYETGDPLVDAFVWVKPPGESDGGSVQGQPGFDWSCAGENNFTPAPRAGTFFPEYVKMLVKNANPPIEL